MRRFGKEDEEKEQWQSGGVEEWKSGRVEEKSPASKEAGYSCAILSALDEAEGVAVRVAQEQSLAEAEFAFGQLDGAG